MYLMFSSDLFLKYFIWIAGKFGVLGDQQFTDPISGLYCIHLISLIA